MYNRYLEQQLPEEVPPVPCRDTPSNPPQHDTSSGNNLLSMLSGLLGQKNGQNDLLSEENLIVLAALAFLAFNGDGIDTELIVLAIVFLLLGL